MALMHACPHCQVDALSGRAVRWSSRECPATCAHCGKLCHVAASTSSGIWSVSAVLLCCAVVAAVLAGSYGLGIAGAVGVVAYHQWAWRRVELFPITAETVRTEDRVRWFLMALAFMGKLLS